MTGGNVVLSTSAEAVCIFGRVASGGTKVAPSKFAKWTVSKASSIYSITFTEAYPEYLGCQATLEVASGIIRFKDYTASTRVLRLETFNVDGTTATDKAFSFVAVFSENQAA